MPRPPRNAFLAKRQIDRQKQMQFIGKGHVIYDRKTGCSGAFPTSIGRNM
jgi:hypothetical protein